MAASTLFKIPMSAPDIGAQEKELVAQVLGTPSLSTGPWLTQFENEFAAYVGMTHGVGVNSGTSGLHLAVIAAGVGAGDLVVTTPFSFVASANSVLYEDGVPIFVDVDAATGNINTEQAVEAMHDFGRVVSRPVVAHQHFEIAIGLPHQRFEAACDIERTIERRHDHADAR